MRAVLSPPEPDGQILYRPYMDSYKRTPKTEVCQVLFAFHDHLKIAKFNSTIHLYSGILFCTSGV